MVILPWWKVAVYQRVELTCNWPNWRSVLKWPHIEGALNYSNCRDWNTNTSGDRQKLGMTSPASRHQIGVFRPKFEQFWGKWWWTNGPFGSMIFPANLHWKNGKISKWYDFHHQIQFLNRTIWFKWDANLQRISVGITFFWAYGHTQPLGNEASPTQDGSIPCKKKVHRFSS